MQNIPFFYFYKFFVINTPETDTIVKDKKKNQNVNI